MPRIKGRTVAQSQKYCVNTVLELIDKTPGQGPNGDCWIWTGRKDKKGYGLSTYGTSEERKHPLQAHRVIYTILVGPIPEGLVVMHSCDNRICVNPAHLTPGTQLENIQDRHSKGRNAVGSKYPSSTLTEVQVEEIKLKRLAGYDFIALAREYSVNMFTIEGIFRKGHWKHVEIDTNDPRIEEFKKICPPPKLRGEKLTAEQVLEIRSALASGARLGELATKYSCSGITIKNILERRAWKNLPL